MKNTIVKDIIQKVNCLITDDKLLWLRVYKNEYGVECICLDKFFMAKFNRVLFLERRYKISIGNEDLNISNSETEKIFNHTKKVLSEYLDNRKSKDIEDYLKL